MKTTITETIKKIAPALVGVILILAIWTLGSARIDNDFILPSISTTLDAVGEIFDSKFARTAIMWSMLRLVTSILIAVAIGYILAICGFFSKFFARMISPLMSVLRTTPVVATVIILVIIFGWHKSPYILVISVITPLMYEAMLTAFNDIPRDYKDVASIYTGSKIKFVQKVAFPVTLTTFAGQLVSAVGLGTKVLISGELISDTPKSIGGEIINARFLFRTDLIFAWVLLIIIFASSLQLGIKIYKSKKRP